MKERISEKRGKLETFLRFVVRKCLDPAFEHFKESPDVLDYLTRKLNAQSAAQAKATAASHAHAHAHARPAKALGATATTLKKPEAAGAAVASPQGEGGEDSGWMGNILSAQMNFDDFDFFSGGLASGGNSPRGAGDGYSGGE